MTKQGANAPLPDVDSAERTFYETEGGVSLHTVTAGETDDPSVVLLHGFPEFWYGWRECVGRLVEEGYRVVVPDQRGYNRSDKPDGIDSYRLPKLCQDVASLVEAEGNGTAHVVGHDWGALVAWNLALRRPETVDSLTAVNVPHPTVFRRTLLSSPTQLRRSWYMFFFQVPGLPEWHAKRDDFSAWLSKMDETSEPGTFDETDMGRYRSAWTEPGASTAMLNWYRAVFRRSDPLPRKTVEAPTLILWGEDDQALVPEMAPKSLRYCENGTLERFPDATHWVNHERPDRVSDLLLEHIDG